MNPQPTILTVMFGLVPDIQVKIKFLYFYLDPRMSLRSSEDDIGFL